MGEMLTLTASDGAKIGGNEAKPAGKPRGGLVVVQEIFGVNAHIRSVADGYAAEGYHVISPAIFDRAERGVELGYDKPDADRGVALRARIPVEETLRDIGAAVAALGGSGKTGIVGYCYGGSLAWMSAARVDGLSAAVGYYGSMVAANLGLKPRCPVMLHFGEEDKGIPMSDIARIRAAVDPAMVQVFTYPGAGHAFNRKGHAPWHEASAKLALERTLEFLRRHVG
ncbi:MAG TPA: dienelactone hydrolase family protein [Bauldia sp.]|nr:dienelactone hydrolase family protein [Bauldia sp.]